MTDEISNSIKSRSLDGVSHYNQIWNGKLTTAAKREVLHGLDDLKVVQPNNKRTDPRVWPALEGRAFNTSINAALR